MRRSWGSVRQKGGWTAIRYTLANGERVQETLPAGTTKRDALKLLADKHFFTLHGSLLRPSSVTVAALLADWLAADHSWANNSLLQHTQSAGRVVAQIGAVKLQELAIGHVETMKANLKEPLSPRTVNLALDSLSSALMWAMQRKLVSENVAGQVRRLTVPRADKTALTPEQATRLFRTCVGADVVHPQARMVAFMLVSLRRYNEAAGLRWADVDLEAKHYTISRGWDNVAHRFLEIPNDKHRYRSYLLCEAAVKALDIQQRCIRALSKNAEAVHVKWKDSDLVFPSWYGRPMPRATLQKALDALCEKADVPRLSVHELRHTGCGLLISTGASKWELMEIGGWSSLAQVEATYSHLFQSDLQRASDRLGELLEGTEFAPDIANTKGNVRAIAGAS